MILALGVAVALRATPLTGVDESFHFRRALQIAQGGLLPKRLGPNDWGGKLDRRYAALGGWLDDQRNAGRPVSIQATRALSDRLAAGPGGTMPSSFPSTASYPPLPYAGAAFGLFAARSTGLDPLSGMLAGRLASLIVNVALMGLTVLVLPYGRFGVLAILTTPAAIDLDASYSADPLTNAIPLLFAALVLRQRASGAPIARVRKALLFVLAISLGLLKLTCALVSLVIVLIPDGSFRSRREAWLCKVALIGLSLGTAVAWNVTHPFLPGPYWSSGGDPAASLRILQNHPFQAWLTVVANIRQCAWGWWRCAYGCFDGGPAPYFFLIGARLLPVATIFTVVAAAADPPQSRNPRAALVLALVAASYVFELLFAFMIGYSKPGQPFIDGVQGRYLLLPLALLLLTLSALLPIRRPALGVAMLGGCLILAVWNVGSLVTAYRALWF